MTDNDLHRILESVFNGETEVRSLDDKTFMFMLGCAARMYNKRLWDEDRPKLVAEYRALMNIFERVQKIVARKVIKKKARYGSVK